jgi:hypothetical protein
MSMFLDESKPLPTCIGKDCDGCKMCNKVNCHFNIKQLLRFMLIVLPTAIIGGIGIIIYNPLFIILWVVMFISFFGFIEIKVMCSHCPHYAETEGKTLKCWANYGSPKLWKYQPGPMTKIEKAIFISYPIIIFILPIVFLLLNNTIMSYILLGLYIIGLVISMKLLKKHFCSYCMNFACPLNNVNQETRENFFDLNPKIKEAWGKES